MCDKMKASKSKSTKVPAKGNGKPAAGGRPGKGVPTPSGPPGGSPRTRIKKGMGGSF